MMLPPDLSPSVQVPLLQVITELGKVPFSFDDLVGYIERLRQKDLRIEEDRMPVGMTGYAVALRDCDLICTRPGLSPLQKRITQLHEMGHFVRGDIARFSRGDKTTVYARFIQLRDRHANVTSRQRFFDYSSPRERDTEALARLCLQYILDYERITPRLARVLAG